MIQDERLRRSETRRTAAGKGPTDSYVRATPEADVVEVVFGTACEIDRLGA